MRLLVISDIHANLEALRAIDEPCDAVLCLGDIVDYGPDPVACINHLRELKPQRIRGNHDNAVAHRVDCGCNEEYLHLSVATRKYMWQVMGQEHIDYVGGPGLSREFEAGGRSVLAVHAAPSDYLFKYLTPETPDDEIAAELERSGADIVLVGHSHKPFIRKAAGKTLVNVGSVGQPRDGIPKASYAVLDNGGVELKRVGYDIEATVAGVMGLPLEEKVREDLAYILRHARMPRE